MSTNISESHHLNMIILSGYVITLIALLTGTCEIVHGYPTASINMFSHLNKLDNKISDDSAEQSFQQFIHSKPESTFIGELKPNSSSLEVRLFKDKIASAIMSMREMDKVQSAASEELLGGDCFIEMTKVERIPGKCHKINNGLPICQSNNYMAINMDCK